MFPENFVLFAAGTVSKNVRSMVELGHDIERGGAALCCAGAVRVASRSIATNSRLTVLGARPSTSPSSATIGRG